MHQQVSVVLLRTASGSTVHCNDLAGSTVAFRLCAIPQRSLQSVGSVHIESVARDLRRAVGSHIDLPYQAWATFATDRTVLHDHLEHRVQWHNDVWYLGGIELLEVAEHYSQRCLMRDYPTI